MKCYKCGHEIEYAPSQRVGTNDTCPNCNAYLHCCLNCRFYDPTCWNECREAMAEWVKDKDRPNKCAYFQPCEHETVYSESRAREARKNLDSLFKKKK